jgi:pentalenene oxygenase
MPGAWPLLGHAPALLRDPLKFLAAAYGLGELVCVRLGPATAYLVNGAEEIRRILVTEAEDYDKGFQFDYLRWLIGDGVATSSGAKHRRQRRLMRPAFDHSHVEGYVATMGRTIADQVEGWEGRRRIEAGAEMRALTMTVFARAMFESVVDPRRPSYASEEILRSLPVLLDGIGRRALLPIPGLNSVPTPGNIRFDRARAGLHAFADRTVADHRAASAAAPASDAAAAPGPADLLSTLLAAVDEDGSGMTDAQAHDEIMTLLLGGTETTAGALAWTLHVLAGDQRLQAEVQREADAVTGRALPSAADLGRLPFTRRVVEEVLRCYPAGWIVGRRPYTDREIAGTVVPAGAQVLLNFYGLHHDPGAYPDPDRFDPDRWLDPDPVALRTHYLPFGLGPHSCIGEGFAWSEMLIAVTAIASRFTLRPVPGSKVRPMARTTLHPGVVPLLLEPRTPGAERDPATTGA